MLYVHYKEYADMSKYSEIKVRCAHDNRDKYCDEVPHPRVFLFRHAINFIIFSYARHPPAFLHFSLLFNICRTQVSDRFLMASKAFQQAKAIFEVVANIHDEVSSSTDMPFVLIFEQPIIYFQWYLTYSFTQKVSHS